MALNFPYNPSVNDIYTDSTSGFRYQWDGTVWKSYTPALTSNIRILDDISGSFNNADTTFPITVDGTTVANTVSAAQLDVTLGGITQAPGTDYSVAGGSNIVFTTPPNTGTSFHAKILGTAISLTEAPADGSITPAKIASAGSFTFGDINVSGITTTGSPLVVTGAGQTVYIGAGIVTSLMGDGTTAGIVTYYGDGTKLTGVGTDNIQTDTEANFIAGLKVGTAATIKSNGNATFSGIVTAGSFVGDGTGLTGVASTDNIQTATPATFLSNVNITGVTTATDGIHVGSAATIAANGNASFSGVVTTTALISTGIITASAFKGGGQIGINTVGGTLGYGVSILNFIGSGISTTLVDNTLGIATIDVSGGGGGSFAPVNYIIG